MRKNNFIYDPHRLFRSSKTYGKWLRKLQKVHKRSKKNSDYYLYISSSISNINFPPKARGVTHFLKDKQGDCGEFSFLYAALCRAIGVPCRVMVGAFAMGKHHAHVWNEVYLPEEGWMPVDVSMAYVVKKQPWRFFSLP